MAEQPEQPKTADVPADATPLEAPGDQMELIRARAHQLWEADGRPEGRADEYWYKAERELAEAELRTGVPDTPLRNPTPRKRSKAS